MAAASIEKSWPPRHGASGLAATATQSEAVCSTRPAPSSERPPVESHGRGFTSQAR